MHVARVRSVLAELFVETRRVSLDENPMVWPFNWNLSSAVLEDGTRPIIILYNKVQIFESMDQ